MSFDYEVVVRGRVRAAARIRGLVAELAALDPAEDDEADDAAADELDLHVANLGSIQICRLARGYRLTIDSNRDGNREHFEALGELVDTIASKLGKVIRDPQVAAEMIEETAVATPPPPALASTAVVTLEAADGRALETAEVYLDHFAEMLDPGGMPSSRAHFARPPLMVEDHRYELRAVRMGATLHGSDGAAFRRYQWRLDGYGRIVGVDITDL